MSAPTTSLQAARVAAGLSQAALARATGISRQSIGAIEAGRHRPSIDAALAIAHAIGRPVEELFQPPMPEAVPLDAPPVPNGSAIIAARVGHRAVFAPATSALAFHGWGEPNAVLRDGEPHLLPGADLDSFVVVGCDPAIGSLAALLPRSGPRRLLALSGSTASALASMRDARAHGALVHGTPGRLPKPPAGALRLRLANWRVGIAQRSRRARGLSELCERRVRFVQREAGASSQKALLAALDRSGCGPLGGPVAEGHLEVARMVKDGAAAGVTMEPAALQLGLTFTPLEEHAAELWVDERWRHHPAVEVLGNTLRSARFTAQLELVPGYDLTGCGDERSDR